MIAFESATIGQSYSACAFVNPREIVAITFDDSGVVRNIERFGLEDGNVVALSRRVTDSNVQGVGSVGVAPALKAAFAERMQELYESDPRLKYVLVFKNFGPAAGASIPHTHSQIIATPVVPQNVEDEVVNSRQYHAKYNQCVFCSLIDEALTYEATIYDRESGEIRRKIDVGQYVVERGRHFVAIKPFASRYEWELHILPLEHQADFLQVTKEQLEDFALVLKRSMQRLDHVIGGAQYNFFLHSKPHGRDYDNCEESYHWHLEICPRTSIPTGFELGSGLFVSTISPEDAAAALRAVELPDESA